MGRCGQVRAGADCPHLKSSGRLGEWCSGSLVPAGPDAMLSASVSGGTWLARYLGADAQIPALSVSGSCKSFAVWTHVSPSIDSSALPPLWSPCVVARRSG